MICLYSIFMLAYLHPKQSQCIHPNARLGRRMYAIISVEWFLPATLKKGIKNDHLSIYKAAPPQLLYRLNFEMMKPDRAILLSNKRFTENLSEQVHIKEAFLRLLPRTVLLLKTLSSGIRKQCVKG